MIAPITTEAQVVTHHSSIRRTTMITSRMSPTAKLPSPIPATFFDCAHLRSENSPIVPPTPIARRQKPIKKLPWYTSTGPTMRNKGDTYLLTRPIRNGNLHLVELHWYEAHAIGKRDLKIKD